MTKKLIAALIALAMCAAMTGCQNVDNGSSEAAANDAAADNSAAAQEDDAEGGDTDGGEEKSDKNEEDEPEDKEEEESAEQESEKPSPTGFEVSPDNIVYTTYDIGYTPTDEEAAKFISLALEQYQAAYDGDRQKFVDLMNLNAVIKPMGTLADELDMETYDIKNKTKYVALSVLAYELYFLSEESDDALIGLMYVSDGAEDIVKQAVDSIDVDSDNAIEELSYIFDDVQELEPMGGVDGSTVVWMEIDGCDLDGDDIYISFDMGALIGDYNYVIDEICGWRIGGEWGVYMGGATLDDNPCKGMTAEEIKEYAAQEAERQLEEDKQSDLDLGAKTAYNALAEYVADCIAMGVDPDERLTESCPKLRGGGIDLAGDAPEESGDKMIYELMRASGYKDGTISMGEYYADLQDFIVTYTGEDGAGRYPGEDRFSDDVIWR